MRDMTKAAMDVLAERERQKAAEGWTPEHDDAQTSGAMARAASCYALFGAFDDSWRNEVRSVVPHAWPWGAQWWKPKSRRADLVRAGALILAEIERLDRASAPEQRYSDRKFGVTI